MFENRDLEFRLQAASRGNRLKAVRALEGKVKQRTVWIRVETTENPSVTAVTVQARTSGGGRDIELTHDLEKQIALKLVK